MTVTKITEKPVATITEQPVVALREQVIKKLADQKIELKYITDNKEIPFFFYERDEDKALKKGLYRAEKYLIKRGIDVKTPIGKEIADNMVEAWGCRCLVDEAMSTVLGQYGIGGGDQLDYRTLAYRIMKIIKDYHVKEWENRVSEALYEWKRKHKVNEEVIHIVALTTAKITAEYFHGSRWRGFRYMRLPKPIEEEAKEENNIPEREEQNGS